MNIAYKQTFMRMTLIMLCCFIGITFTPPPIVEANSKVATLKDIKGDVYIKKGGGKREVKASNNMGITQGDTIRTGKKAYVKVVFDSKNATSLGENTSITVAKLAEKNGISTTKVKQTSGKVWNKVSKSSYEVETPTSIMGVRGTLFFVYFDENGRANLSVFDGIVGARDPSPDSVEQPVNPFEQLRAERDRIESMLDRDIQNLVRTFDDPLLVEMTEDMISEIREKLTQSEGILNQFGDSIPIENLISAALLSQGAENLYDVTEILLGHIRNEGKNDVLNEIEGRVGRDTRSNIEGELRRNQERIEERVRQQGREEILRQRQEEVRKQVEQLREQRQQEQSPSQSSDDDGGGGGDSPPIEPEQPPLDPEDPPTEPEQPPLDPEDPPTEPEQPPLDPENPPTEPEQPPLDPGDPPTEPEQPPVNPPAPPVGIVTGKVYEVCPEMECPDSYRADPVEDANVIIKMDGVIVGEAKTDAEGSFEFKNVKANKPFLVEASFDSPFAGYVTIASTQQQLKANGTVSVELIFNSDEYKEPTGMVTGYVYLCSESDSENCQNPAAGALIVIEDDWRGTVAEGESGVDGHYSFEVPIGTDYQIFVNYNDEWYVNYINEGGKVKTIAKNLLGQFPDTTPYTFNVNEDENNELDDFLITPIGECGLLECKMFDLMESTFKYSDKIITHWNPVEMTNFGHYRIYLNNEEVGQIESNDANDTMFTFESLEPDTFYLIKVAAYAQGAQYPEAIAVMEARTEKAEKAVGKVSGTVNELCPPVECGPGGRLDPVSEATVRIKIDGMVWGQKEITDDDEGQFEFLNVPANKDFTVEATFETWSYGREVTIASDLQRLEPNGEITVELIFDIFEHIGFVEGQLYLCEYGDWDCENSTEPQYAVEVTILNEAEDVVEETGVYSESYFTELPIGNNYRIGVEYLSEQYKAYKLGNDIVVAVSQRYLDWEAFFEAIFVNQFYSLFPKENRTKYTFNVEQGENMLPPIKMNPYQLVEIENLQGGNASNEQVSVSWDSYEHATQYHCILGESSTNRKVVEDDTGPLSCTFDNLQPDMEYRITVVAVTQPEPDMILPVAVKAITVKTQ